MAENEGDLGAGRDDTHASLPHTRMEEKAIRERWPMSRAVRVKVLKRLTKIVDEDAFEDEDEKPSTREVISAARALISADKLNLEQEKLDRALPIDETPVVRDVIAEAEEADAKFDSGADPDAADEVPPGPEPVQ